MIIAEEGISGIYKGAGPKLLQSVLTAAILFASQRRIYELTKVTPSFFICIRILRAH
jgi:solute carrier family 25 (peroxisomal adenine nucleotide transporter), member 17